MNKTDSLLPTVCLKEIIYGLTLIAIPFWFNLHYVLVTLFYTLLLYRYIIIKKPKLQPGKEVLFLLTLIAAALVFYLANGVFGKTAGTSLLLVGTGLKLLELKNQRDSYIMLALGYLLTLTQFLFNQNISTACYLFIVIILLTTTLTGLHCNTEIITFRQRINSVTPLIVQALPLALFLFFLFPRIPGPLWSLPDEKGGSSGLSDNLEPGKINELSLSDELAFRVNFKGQVPAQNQLYWRGPVFWWTDGQRWEMRQLPNLNPTQNTYSGNPVDYTIIMEPHGHKWMLALDFPQQIPVNSAINGDFQLVSNDNIHERRLYDIRSYHEYHFKELSAAQKRLALQLPTNFHPEALINLVNGWRENHSDKEVVALALAYFHDNNFYYSLHPPRLIDHPVERFLLETKKGFCEHYATAFVVLMRLAGIPARVITGYQGGQWNKLGNFLEVRQSDAHAWTEVWLNEQGWLRVDPTAAVAPQRIEKPFDFEFTTEEYSYNRNSNWSYRDNSSSWSKSLYMLKANIDHGWHQWILGYNQSMQNKLFNWLDNISWLNLSILIGCILIVILLPFIWLFWQDSKLKPSDPIQLIYLQFCKKLEKAGLFRSNAEGPLAFAHRTADTLPRLSDEIQAIASLYVNLRYGKAFSPVYLKLFHRLVKNFKLI